MEIRYIASSDDRTAISRIYEESWIDETNVDLIAWIFSADWS